MSQLAQRRRCRPRPGSARPAVLLVVLLAVAALAGCGGGGTVADTLSATTATAPAATVSSGAPLETSTSVATLPTTGTTAGAALATTTTTVLSSAETDLGNGLVRAGGFVTRAWEEAGQRRLEIDYADFLTGEAGQAAAEAAGEEFNNDYYIRNESGRLRTFIVTPTAEVGIPKGDPQEATDATWAEFVDLVQSDGWPSFWWIERRGMEIVRIEGQWTP